MIVKKDREHIPDKVTITGEHWRVWRQGNRIQVLRLNPNGTVTYPVAFETDFDKLSDLVTLLIAMGNEADRT